MRDFLLPHCPILRTQYLPFVLCESIIIFVQGGDLAHVMHRSTRMYMDLWDIKCVKSLPSRAKCANDGFFELFIMSTLIRNFVKCLRKYNYEELITRKIIFPY